MAALYFGLMELLLIDSARELREAQRFRSRIVALTLAENGAERAALQMRSGPRAYPPQENELGKYSGRIQRIGPSFRIRGDGEATGVVRQAAWVEVAGYIEPNGDVTIARTTHSQ